MAKTSNMDISVKLDLEKNFANDDSDIFLSACLLQFPYGRGGLNATRFTGNDSGSLTDKSDIEKYIKHLNRLSEVEFQEPFFQLMSYSMLCKLKLIRRSRLQLRGKHTAESLANGLTSDDVSATIRGRAIGNRHAGTNASRTLLKAVDACTAALPHTNEASRHARSHGDAMQHHFGRGSVFITNTFDDENSLLMQVLHGEEIDTDVNLKTISDEELASRSSKRKELRIKYPGLAAKNFDMLLQIVMEEVIGWDMRKNRSTGKPGLFGICIAASLAFEDQGRTTVHSHGTAWMEKLREKQHETFFGNYQEKREATALLSRFHERVTTTSLMETDLVRTACDHPCVVKIISDRSRPEVVPDQQLRILRHKKGYQALEGVFVKCPHCSTGFTNETLLNRYIHNHAKFVACLPCLPAGQTK
jgi:hypothetical protein